MVDAALAAGLQVAVCSTSNERAVAAVVRKLLGDLTMAKVEIGESEIRAALAEQAIEARRQITGEA
jgi:hypothetical protein